MPGIARNRGFFRVIITLGLLVLPSCGGGGGGPPSSSGIGMPVASAGSDQYVTTNSVVTLDGSVSDTSNGDLLSFSWFFISQPAGSLASISNPTAVRATFVPDVEGKYVIALTVKDGINESTEDLVTIIASTVNSAPVAKAGANQNVATGDLVTLDGSGSSDADGDALTYLWSFTSKPVGSRAALSVPTAVRPNFTADADGEYVLKLVVSDGALASAAATVTVTASSVELGTCGQSRSEPECRHRRPGNPRRQRLQ